MFRRQIRSILPIISTPLPKKLCKTKDETSKGRDLQELKAGDIVRFRKDGTWSRKGMVIDKSSQSRSYKIKKDNGTITRRNRLHLLLTKEQFEGEMMSDSDTDASA